MTTFDKHSRNKDGTETAENEMKMINTWNDTKSDQLLQTNYAILLLLLLLVTSNDVIYEVL